MKTKGMRMAVLAMATALTLMGCVKKESTNTTQAENDQAVNVNEEAYPEDFFEAIDILLDTYLLFDADQMAERIQTGSEMGGMELTELEDSAKEMVAEAARLHRSCKTLLNERNMKALHDTIYENWQTFIVSPNSNLENEYFLINAIQGMTKTEYPNDSIRFYAEGEELLDWHAFHFWMIEKLGQEEVNISDEHIATIMNLMIIRNKLGKYDECIKTGEEFIEHLKQYSPQHEAIEMIEDMIKEVRGRKEK